MNAAIRKKLLGFVRKEVSLFDTVGLFYAQRRLRVWMPPLRSKIPSPKFELSKTGRTLRV